GRHDPETGCWFRPVDLGPPPAARRRAFLGGVFPGRTTAGAHLSGPRSGGALRGFFARGGALCREQPAGLSGERGAKHSLAAGRPTGDGGKFSGTDGTFGRAAASLHTAAHRAAFRARSPAAGLPGYFSSPDDL